MTIYASTEDYTAYLLGKEAVIDTVSFNFYARQASKEINKATYNRIVEVTDNVKMCCCEVAELIYSFDTSKQKRGISSEKVGEYSIGYVAPTTNDLALKARAIIQTWLADTGLLYCGVT